jgi:gas vesicle protein
MGNFIGGLLIGGFLGAALMALLFMAREAREALEVEDAVRRDFQAAPEDRKNGERGQDQAAG